MKHPFFTLLALAVLGLLLLVNGWVLSDLQDIGRSFPMPTGQRIPEISRERQTVRIGVVSRFAPNIIYAGYQPILDYLNRHGTFHYELRLSSSYQDALDRLMDGEVAASFLGAYMTSQLDPEGILVPLMAPLNAQGQSEFHVVLVTRPGSGITSLEQLKGRKVALPSAQSWSGNWLSTAGLSGAGIGAADLDTLHHFEHHQTVVWKVLRGHFDAGVVKESVADRYQPEGLVLLDRSPGFPGPPLVGNRLAAPEALAEIARLLLDVNPASPEGQSILASWTSEFRHGFVPITLDEYRRAFETLKEAP